MVKYDSDKYNPRISIQQAASFAITEEYQVKNQSTTKQELLKEISSLKKKIQELEQSESERKRMEETLFLESEFNRLVIENAGQGICVCHGIEEFPYVRFTVWNECMTLITGYSLDEINRLGWYQSMYPDPAVQERAIIRMQSMRVGDDIRGEEWEITRSDGHKRQLLITTRLYTDSKGEPLVLGVMNDITDRKRTEDTLRESEEKYRLIAENTADLISILDMNLHFTYVSPASVRLRGFTVEEAMEQALDQVLTPESMQLGLSVFEEEMQLEASGTADPDRTRILELEEYRKDGSTIWLEVNLSFIRDKDRKPVAILIVSRDISERKLAEYRQNLVSEIMDIINESTLGVDTINRILISIKREMGFDAVGIRLRSGDDFPYFVQNGFSDDFLLSENTITVRDKDGGICRDKNGNISLECTCGLVISGQTDPANSLFTQGGSAWTNNSFQLLDLTAEQDPRLHPRNRCVHAGYRSVALIPIRTNQEIVGLLQLNDRKKDCFTLDLIHYFESLASSIGIALNRKQAEEALKASLSLLSASMESTADGILIVDRKGKIAQWNQKFADMWKIPEEVLSSRDDEKAVNHILAQLADAEQFVAKVRKLYEQPEESSFDQIEFLDGRVFERYSQPQKIGDNIVGRAWSFRDITERKKAEDGLRESEKRFRELAELLPETVYETDMQGILTFVNRKAFDRFGYTQEDFAGGLNTLDMVTPDDRGRALESMKRIMNSEDIRSNEYTMLRKDGSTFPALIHSTVIINNGKPSGLRGFIIDITERKRMEEESSRLASVIRHSREIVNLATPNGMMLFLNDTGKKMLGISEEDVTQTNILSVIPEHLLDKVRQEVLPSIAEDGYWEGVLQYLNLKTGGLTDVHAITYKIADPETGVMQFMANVSLDITERKRAEAEKMKLEEQYRQAQKMEAIGQLAGGVAHDFNNMLNIILGYSQLALLKIEPSSPLNADLQEIMNATKRSTDLVRQLLAFARKQTIAPKTLDFNDTVAGMLNMLRKLIGEDIDLLWMPAANLWPVKMDPTQVDQLLANLAVNARDSISGVGKITIETGKAEFDDSYCAQHSGFVSRQYAMLAVSDNGCGMDKETCEKIFEPFFTTKEIGKGTGMGLATVYGIVKQNNGFVNVYSEPGKGTTFKIYLPRHGGEEVRDEPHAHPKTLTGTETVLLVEDNEALLKMAKIMLEELGYTVLAAGSPDEAIRLAGEHGELAGDIHLLVTDVVMPEMSGRDLQKRISALRPGIKCLFMSGYTTNVIAHRGILDEGVNFLQKPFSMNDMATKVREALEKVIKD